MPANLRFVIHLKNVVIHAAQLDLDEFERPLISQLLVVLGTAVGIAVAGVLSVGFFFRRMLLSLEQAWDRGRLAVQEQKEKFETLVSALYPKFASEKLLAGDHQIVMEVPEV